MPRREVDITFRMVIDTGDLDIDDTDIFSRVVENQIMAPLREEMGEAGFEAFSQRALRVLVYDDSQEPPALQERNNTGTLH